MTRVMAGMGALMLLGASAQADEMIMQNGSKLIGKLISAEGGSVVFETPFTGQINVKKANIVSIVTDENVVLQMEDGTILRDRRINSSETHLLAEAPGAEPVLFETSEIRMINPPPWKLGEGYDWTGSASAALETERGNSDTDEWNVESSMEWISLKDRYTLSGDSDVEKNNGDKTTDDWNIRGKYDRFFSDDRKNYIGFKTWFEYDRFADLDLRTTVGPHIGRQLLNRPLLSLEGEVGPVWVDENFDTAEDNDFPGALWSLQATSNVLGFGTTLYMNHDGTLNFDSPDDLILNTTFGIRMPLIFGFETKIEGKWEYDGGAVAGVDDLDETYNFRIGYSW